MKERYFTQQAIVTEYPDTDMVVGTYEAPNGRPYAIAYQGKSSRPYFHYRFRDEESRAQYIARAVANRTTYLKRKAQRKADEAKARKLAAVQVAVGDIFVYSWGWEQTNVSFYEVVEKRGASTVILREIGAERTETGRLCGEAVPCPGQFLDPSEPLTKRIAATSTSSPCFSMDYGIASKWSGTPVYWSCYA